MTFSCLDGPQLGTNLAYTRFFFVRPTQLDDAIRQRLRTVGDQLARGFFNVFDLEGGGADSPPHEMIQLLSINGFGVDKSASAHLAVATHVAQVTSKYSPSLDDSEKELRRRVADLAEVTTLSGAVRVPKYTSVDMYAWAYAQAKGRTSGRTMQNAIILPIRKTAEWWAMDPMTRHQYFYPHHDRHTGQCVAGHAELGRAAAPKIFRRLFYNPNGEGLEGEWDFITYFECADDDLALFDETLEAMRDTSRNPEWQFVEEGPIWRGRRSLRW
ncbi:MAG: hypothetical protein O2917_00625 [Acidobacteria bacterium]|nr:hypothetical protein [Acidobacteriota bacterium]